MGLGDETEELTETREGRAERTAAASGDALPSPGDHAGFAALIAVHDDGLRALAYHLLGSRQAMDDVLQEVYVKAYRGLASFRGDASVGTWLHRIAYRTCIDHLRRAADTEPLPPDAIDRLAPAGTSEQDELEERDLVHRALAELPADQRVAVLLVLREGYSYTDAAGILGVPRGTVASRVSAARSTLLPALSLERGGEQP